MGKKQRCIFGLKAFIWGNRAIVLGRNAFRSTLWWVLTCRELLSRTDRCGWLQCKWCADRSAVIQAHAASDSASAGSILWKKMASIASQAS